MYTVNDEKTSKILVSDKMAASPKKVDFCNSLQSDLQSRNYYQKF